MRIAVHGATGFTGGLAVAELVRRGITPVLVGRSPERLKAVAAERAPGAEVRVAEVRVAGAGGSGGADRVADEDLAAAFADCDAVVNCAGPFDLWGEPVVRAAIAAGAHYVDTTGEQRYLRRVLDTFGPEAGRAGVSVVPAMADDGGPGDLIARLTADRLGGPVDDLLVADLRRPDGGASRGTGRSMAAAFSAGALEYSDGGWHLLDAPVEDSLVPPGEEDAVPVTTFALPGVVTVPRHLAVRRVRSAVRTEVAGLFSALTPEVVAGLPESVPEELRRSGVWLMAVHATGVDGRRARGWVTGTDAYGLTAVIAVEGARRLATGEDAARPGVLTPAQAFPPAAFLDFLAPYGVDWRVEEVVGGEGDGGAGGR
ncbi:saccharopine dehydrogenase family protein [Kitasatospora sp. NBC_00458]|uniref:saccharopine dehydrogenase family protein n=1 Tax=Kitasatospora sp. NBC_00458 TaxID=2903568 RepID=UPI002E16D7FF